MKTSHYILLIFGIVFSVISFTPDISILYSHLCRAIAIFLGIFFLKVMHKSSLDKMAIPEARAGIYVPMALAITFPINITIGFPLYMHVIQMVRSGGGQ